MNKLHFSLADIMLGLFALGGVSTSYGVLNAKVAIVEERQEKLENTQEVLLTQLRNDITEMKVELAKVATDIEWMRQNLPKTDE
jgi:HAMP domain-containing protein